MATALATRESILAGSFDDIEFEARLEEGHLVLGGILAEQDLLDEIPVGIYVMERDGTVVACNETAIAAWGRTPELGATERFCGAFRLRYPSGDVMPHELAPPSVALNNGGTIRDADVICEQPDGTRLLALVNIFPIRDADEQVIGAVNVFRHNTTKVVPGLFTD